MAEQINLNKPRITHLDNPSEGQAFDHELESSRDWETTLDALHYLLVQKWYYVAIASNTKGGAFTLIQKKKIDIHRGRKDIPEELEIILKMRMATFGELDGRIKQKMMVGGNKDIWHFKTQWKELPKGTSVIQIYQRPLWNLLSSDPVYRKAFIIIDGQAEVEHQNQAMFIISKVLHNKEHCEKILKKAEKEPVKEAKPMKRRRTIYTGRPTGELILLLKESFGIHVRTLSVEERVALGYYFDKLHRTGEEDESHKDLQEHLKKYYKTEDLKKLDE
ncbi:MAG: hypothetical protein RRB13_11360 [bacterium]|nr:hypothetical protein [bacterium]